jgi:hypothetical protein
LGCKVIGKITNEDYTALTADAEALVQQEIDTYPNSTKQEEIRPCQIHQQINLILMP